MFPIQLITGEAKAILLMDDEGNGYFPPPARSQIVNRYTPAMQTALGLVPRRSWGVRNPPRCESLPIT